MISNSNAKIIITDPTPQMIDNYYYNLSQKLPSDFYQQIVEKENENNNGDKGENCDKTGDFDSFPGKIYNICCATSFNRRELKAALAGIDRATVSTRNFPLSPDEVRRKLRPVVTLRDGGTTHLFATTVLGKKMLLVAEPAVP